ncbi:MAG TPA: glycosyltransferase family 2 protein [Polyangiaceae bacterium]
MRRVTIMMPCYNEEGNVRELHRRVSDVVAGLSDRFEFDFIFIDNASTDGTAAILRELAATDRRVKVIINARNFGHIRSPHHAILQAEGDAVICMASDLQDPPELIPDFIAKWEEGYRVVVGVKAKSEESFLFYWLRTMYYKALRRLSDIELIEHFTGFGLYDRRVVQVLRTLDDPYPYFRGLIADLGFRNAKIKFTQPLRKRGITKNNFYTLFDMAMLGFTSHSKLPLRLATFIGFISGLLSFLVGVFYLGYKLANWNGFVVGLAPLVIGLFFFASIQLVFLGIVGEYVGAIHTQVQKRPLVVEAERINFSTPELRPEQPRTIAVANPAAYADNSDPERRGAFEPRVT